MIGKFKLTIFMISLFFNNSIIYSSARYGMIECLRPGDIKFKLRYWFGGVSPEDLKTIEKHLGPYDYDSSQSIKLYELLFNIDMAGGTILDSISFHQLKEKFYHIQVLEKKLRELNLYKEDFRDDIKRLLNNKNIGKKEMYQDQSGYFSPLDEYQHHSGKTFDEIQEDIKTLEQDENNPISINHEELFSAFYYLGYKPKDLEKLYNDNPQKFLDGIKKAAKECK